MNYTVIVLGILLLLSIYVLNLYLNTTTSSLVTSTSLLTNAPAITNLNNPTSPRYAYGLWIYVNSWGSNGSTPKIIFYRHNNIKMYLEPNKLNLNVDVFMNNGHWLSSEQNLRAPVLVTDNFPLQKWCHIIVSMDNSFLDCYLDGKLVLSQKLNFISSGPKPSNISPMPPPDLPSDTGVAGGAAVILGGTDSGSGSLVNWTNFDAVVNNFKQWSNPLNPQMAWQTYMSGNGSSPFSVSSFNAKVNILKDNVAFTSFSLF